MDIKIKEHISQRLEVMHILNNYDPKAEEASIVVDADYETGKCSSLAEGMSKNKTSLPNHLVVDGNINSKADIYLEGRVNGNVKTTEDFSSNGVLVGNVSANNASFGDAKIFGNTEARESVIVGESSIVVGNIKASEITIDGKVKGLIEATDTANFLKNAVVVADIKTGKINVDGQAKLNANITLVSDKNKTLSDDEFKMDLGEK